MVPNQLFLLNDDNDRAFKPEEMVRSRFNHDENQNAILEDDLPQGIGPMPWKWF